MNQLTKQNYSTKLLKLFTGSSSENDQNCLKRVISPIKWGLNKPWPINDEFLCGFYLCWKYTSQCRNAIDLILKIMVQICIAHEKSQTCMFNLPLPSSIHAFYTVVIKNSIPALFTHPLMRYTSVHLVVNRRKEGFGTQYLRDSQKIGEWFSFSKILECLSKY